LRGYEGYVLLNYVSGTRRDFSVTFSSGNADAITIGKFNGTWNYIDYYEAMQKQTPIVLAQGITLQKCGNMRIVSCTNGAGEIPTDGISIGESTGSDNYYARARYYNGSQNVFGWIGIRYNKLYLYNETTANTSGTYVTGQIVYFV
jgi:hypothetical protein